MRPEFERVKERIRSGDVSQEALDALVKSVPTDKDFEEIMGGAPSDIKSFKDVDERLKRLEDFIKKPSEEELKPKVRFIDYDGTVIDQVFISDLPIKKMPKAPDHSNDFIPLEFAGWTTTLKKINSRDRNLDVGAMYRPIDGNTHLVVEVTDLENSTATFKIRPIDADIVVDFGNGETATVPAFVPDGNTGTPEQVTITCTYLETGKYDVCVSTEAQDIELNIMCVSNTEKLVRDVVFGSNVQSIGSDSYYFPYMRTLVIPDSVKILKQSAFYNADRLLGIVIPNSVHTISDNVFTYMYVVENLVIPDSVQNFGSSTIYYCNSLKSLVIPDSIEMLAGSVATFCYSLHSVVIGDKVRVINYMCNYCYSLHELILPDSLETISGASFQYDYSLKRLDLGGVKNIGSSSAFYYSYSIDTLIIGDKMERLPGNNFQYTYALKNIVFGKKLKVIDGQAFYYGYSLQNLVIPDTVEEIGNSVCSYCYSLRNLVIGDNVQKIGSSSFGYSYSLENLVLGKSVKLYSNMFSRCYALKNLILSEGIKSIPYAAFQDAYSLKSLVIPNSVKTIGSNAFNFCYSLEKIVLGNGLKTIEGNAFRECYSLKELVIPDNVTSGIYASFTSCYSLEKLVIGSRVLGIGGSFSSCYSLDNVFIKNTPERFGDSYSSIDADIEWADLVGIEIASTCAVAGVDTPLELNYIFDRAKEGDRVFTVDGFDITCSDNATYTDGQIHTDNDSGKITVTVTSTEDPTYSVTKELDIIPPSVTVDLNNGQWMETEETVDGHTVYRSDAFDDSYQVGDKFICTIKAFGYSTLKIWAKKSGSNDYFYLGYADGDTSDYWRNIYRSDYDSSPLTYSLSPYEQTTIPIWYQKGYNYGSQGESRAFFYFTVE